MIDLTATYATLYQMMLFTLVEIDRGAHGEVGHSHRASLAQAAAEMRALLSAEEVKLYDA